MFTIVTFSHGDPVLVSLDIYQPFSHISRSPAMSVFEVGPKRCATNKSHRLVVVLHRDHRSLTLLGQFEISRSRDMLNVSRLFQFEVFVRLILPGLVGCSTSPLRNLAPHHPLSGIAAELVRVQWSISCMTWHRASTPWSGNRQI